MKGVLEAFANKPKRNKAVIKLILLEWRLGLISIGRGLAWKLHQLFFSCRAGDGKSRQKSRPENKTRASLSGDLCFALK